MDACKAEELGTAALRKNTEQSLRRPLTPSEKNNAAPVVRRPRTRDVTSRYKSGVTPISVPPPSTPARSQRCPSPNAGRVGLSPMASVPKRSLSADRKRPATPTSQTAVPSSPSRTTTVSSPSLRPSTPARHVTADLQASSRRLGGARMPDGLWPAMRSLSASFQAESISNGLSKRDNPVSNSNVISDFKLKSSGSVTIERRRTPSRGKNASDQSENSRSGEHSSAKVPDQHRWPGIMNGKFSARTMSRSMDLTDRGSRAGTLPASPRGISPTRRANISDAQSRGLEKTASAVARRMSLDGSGRLEHEFCSISGAGTLPASSRGVSPTRRAHVSDALSGSLQKSTSEVTRRMSLDRSGRLEHEFSTIRKVSVDFSEGTPSLTHPSRTLSLPLPGSPHPPSPSKASLTSASSSRGMASPSRSRPSTPASPSRASLAAASSTRNMASPSRTRPSSPASSSCIAGRAGVSSSVLSYILDVRKGKKSANDIDDAHHLRLLYNRYLQWRFFNAQAGASMSMQKVTMENILYTVWAATSKMHDSVIMKRINMQQSRQEMKLGSILKDQTKHLEDWGLVEREHLSSLLGAIESLKASTLRLPVISGARADVQALKDAISSAVDIMQAMSSSICHLLSMVEGTNSVVSELAELAAQESIMLVECRELLATTAAVQVQESSLKTHLLQLRQDMIRLEGPISTVKM